MRRTHPCVESSSTLVERMFCDDLMTINKSSGAEWERFQVRPNYGGYPKSGEVTDRGEGCGGEGGGYCGN